MFSVTQAMVAIVHAHSRFLLMLLCVCTIVSLLLFAVVMQMGSAYIYACIVELLSPHTEL